MKPVKKVTVHLPSDLLAKAQDFTGEGITDTVRRGLELVAAGAAYENIKKMRGKVAFSLKLKKMREDRS